MSKVLNAIKDGYLRAVDWVDQNPQKTIWLGLAAVILALVI